MRGEEECGRAPPTDLVRVRRLGSGLGFGLGLGLDVRVRAPPAQTISGSQGIEGVAASSMPHENACSVPPAGASVVSHGKCRWTAPELSSNAELACMGTWLGLGSGLGLRIGLGLG